MVMTKIKKIEITDMQGTDVHWEGHDEFTLCGLEALSGDPGIGLEAPVIVNKPVTCDQCKAIVNQVRKIIKS